MTLIKNKFKKRFWTIFTKSCKEVCSHQFHVIYSGEKAFLLPKDEDEGKNLIKLLQLNLISDTLRCPQ